MPGGAAEIAHRLGIRSPGAYDLNAACAGFVYAVASASNAILTGQAHNVLVVGAEKLSDWIDYADRTACIIFADGAGAAVVTASDTPGIGPVVWGSDGDHAAAITTKPETARARPGRPDRLPLGDLDGRRRRRSRPAKLAGIKPSDLAAFVPHQANLRIIDLVAKKLGITADGPTVVARDIVTSGNTSAASIPIALSKLIDQGVVPSGAPVLVVGFGAGLTYAGQVILSP